MALLMCFALVCCGGKKDAADSTTIPDVASMKDKVKGFYGENVEFIAKADEYSNEVFQFSYQLEDEKFFAAAEDYLLTQCDGMSAETFVAIKFRDGVDKSMAEEAAEIIKTKYVAALKGKLEAYNPEAFAAADDFKVTVYDNGLVFVICPDKADDVLAALK